MVREKTSHSRREKGRSPSSRVVLLTGAGGFIGRQMARGLKTSGYEVVGIDLLPPENAPLSHLKRYYQMALPHPNLESLIEKERPDACVHCAGRASVGMSVQDPRTDFQSGTVATMELLEALRRAAPRCHLVFLSSAAVYGEPTELPVRETHPINPISPYGFHKRQAELLCEEYASVYGLPTSAMRIFSAYGPGLRRQVIWDICHQIVTQGTLALRGTGDESRDFVHVTDIVAAARILLEKGETNGNAYNVGVGEEITIRALAEQIADVLGFDKQPEFDGLVPEAIPRNWKSDIRLLKELGFKPEVDLDRGLRSFVTWCRAEIAGV